MSHKKEYRPTSIDAMMDMERMEVLALLESKDQAAYSSPAPARSSSPFLPRSPVRSLVDIAEDDGKASPSTGAHGRPSPATQGPVRSMLDVDSSGSSSTAAPVRSMLDVDSPAPGLGSSTAKSGRSSTPGSPLMGSSASFRQASSIGPHPRSRSDAGLPRADFGSRASNLRNDPMAGYQFSGILPQNPAPQRAKWFSMSSSSSSSSSSKAGPSSTDAQSRDGRRNTDLSGLQLPQDRGRNLFVNSRLSNSHHQSKSPANRRWGSRSRSPATFAPQNLMLDDGQVVDISNAYRRLSDANLALSRGSLGQLPRKRNEVVGEGRLIKDYLGPDGEHLDSSEDDEPFTSEDEERGRKKDPRSPDFSNLDDAQKSGSEKEGRPTLSLLAAAEEERSRIAQSQSQAQHQYSYRSLFAESEAKATNTPGDLNKNNKGRHGVHPATSYDQGPTSANASVVDSDEEAEVDDIKRAQKLAFTMTNIYDTAEAHRAIRIIYRGEYNKIVQAAEEENHRLRKYLVATDLSDESAHALEWAIGTVIRDGDTLIAIYCVDEETGITGEGLSVPDETKAMKEQAAAINTISNTKLAPAQISPVTEFRRTHLKGQSGSALSTPAGSPARLPNSGADSNRAEQERHRAVQFITDQVLSLLRKTKLQVRVIVEVLHCKNPKHLVTEVIDLVNPTLVVIGSRGRSALKGVILGSFSNYLVTKSSVPVMVARKRLRKQSKYKRTAVRQVNNLSNPATRSLANAIIDK